MKETELRPRLSGKLSVVFSFYNEAHIIPELVSRCETIARKMMAADLALISDYELIFVNDASTDDSVEVLSRLRSENPRIKVLNMSRNFGVSPCVMAGFDFATGDCAIYMDADLQDPPELWPTMVAKWREGFDVVHTHRTERRGESSGKLVLTRIGYAILKRFSEVQIRPNSGDYKLISRRALEQVRRHHEKRPFMRGIVTSVGFNQVYVPYERDARLSGPTKFPIFSYRVISNFIDSALISFSDGPLKIVSLTGMLISLLSFFLVIHVVIEKINGRNIPGWTALMVTVSFFSGIQIISLGVLGLYLNAIFLESKGRPRYIVESAVGFDQSPHPHPQGPEAWLR